MSLSSLVFRVNLQEKGSDESCVSEAAPTWMHINGVPKKPYRKPEALSVKVSFNNAESAAFGQKHPVNFHYNREPHKQHVDQEDLMLCLMALDHMHQDVAVPLSFYLLKSKKKKIKSLFFFIYNLINVYNIL